jgi:hypothetical protein
MDEQQQPVNQPMPEQAPTDGSGKKGMMWIVVLAVIVVVGVVVWLVLR